MEGTFSDTMQISDILAQISQWSCQYKHAAEPEWQFPTRYFNNSLLMTLSVVDGLFAGTGAVVLLATLLLFTDIVALGAGLRDERDTYGICGCSDGST